MIFSDLLKAYLLKAMANTQNRTYTKPEPRTLKAKTDMVIIVVNGAKLHRS